MSAEAIADLMARVTMLEAQVSSQDRILRALSLCLPVSRRFELLRTFTALQLNAASMGDVDGARAMTAFVERWKALCGEDLQAPVAHALLAINSQSLLHSQTPASHRDALQTWLSVATPQEIAQDIDAKLPSPTARPGGAKRKKKPGAQ